MKKMIEEICENCLSYDEKTGKCTFNNSNMKRDPTDSCCMDFIFGSMFYPKDEEFYEDEEEDFMTEEELNNKSLEWRRGWWAGMMAEDYNMSKEEIESMSDDWKNGLSFAINSPFGGLKPM